MSKKSILLVSALALSTTSFLGQPIEKWKNNPDIQQLTSFGGLQTAYAESQITVKLDGENVVFSDTQPQIIEGRTLVPVRGVFEKMGFKVDWNGETKTASLSKDGQNVEIIIGNSYFTLNGEQKSLDVPAQVIKERTMLPLRAISEATNAKVDWDANTKTVTITTKEQAPPVEQPQISNLPKGAVYYDNGTEIEGRFDINGNYIYLGEYKESVESKLGQPIRATPPKAGYEEVSPTRFIYKADGFDIVQCWYASNGRLVYLSVDKQGFEYLGWNISIPYDRNYQPTDTAHEEQWGDGGSGPAGLYKTTKDLRDSITGESNLYIQSSMLAAYEDWPSREKPKWVGISISLQGPYVPGGHWTDDYLHN